MLLVRTLKSIRMENKMTMQEVNRHSAIRSLRSNSSVLTILTTSLVFFLVWIFFSYKETPTNNYLKLSPQAYFVIWTIFEMLLASLFYLFGFLNRSYQKNIIEEEISEHIEMLSGLNQLDGENKKLLLGRHRDLLLGKLEDVNWESVDFNKDSANYFREFCVGQCEIVEKNVGEADSSDAELISMGLMDIFSDSVCRFNSKLEACETKSEVIELASKEFEISKSLVSKYCDEVRRNYSIELSAWEEALEKNSPSSLVPVY